MENNSIKTQQEIDLYTSEIYILVDEFINNALEANPAALADYGLFPRLIQYIYNNYIMYLLDNNKTTNQNKYNDINLLDKLFNIYVDLVYKYKATNKRPSITEYCIFTGICRNTIYDWLHSNDRYINNTYRDVIEKWYMICEQSLIDDNKDVVKSIFLLKAKHGYQEQPTQVIVSSGQQVLSAADLPQLNVNNMSQNDMITGIVADDPIQSLENSQN